jgi:transposase
MTENSIPKKLTGRVIGLDCHPDSFTAIIVLGRTPAEAVVEKSFNHVPLGKLESWAKHHTLENDHLVLEASGNSFHLARLLRALGRQALVLESHHLSKMKDAHANNDKISATRIAKAFLSGTCKEVWVPDAKTQDRRNTYHAYSKSVTDCTRSVNRLRSFLSDHGVRLPELSFTKESVPNLREPLTRAKTWNPCETLVIDNGLIALECARKLRANWEQLMAFEVCQDPVLLSLTRLCGVRQTVAFAIGAFVGPVSRFASPKKLVKYVGLHPSFDDSGETDQHGGLSGHGHRELRSLLIESAHSVMRSRSSPLGKWARRLEKRKGSPLIAVTALARKLLVAIWYLLSGRWDELSEIDKPMAAKVSKVMQKAGELLGPDRKKARIEIEQKLKHGRVYVLKEPAKMTPRKKTPAASPPMGEDQHTTTLGPDTDAGPLAEYGIA